MTDAFQTLLAEATPYYNARLEELRTTFRIFAYERYDFDQETALLTFSHAGIAKVHATAQMIGSHSTVSDTWLWSWKNPYILPALTASAQSVRDYGEAHSIEQLVLAKFPASEDDAWHIAAISAFILRAQGVYRCPVPIGSTFLALTSVSWAS